MFALQQWKNIALIWPGLSVEPSLAQKMELLQKEKSAGGEFAQTSPIFFT